MNAPKGTEWACLECRDTRKDGPRCSCGAVLMLVDKDAIHRNEAGRLVDVQQASAHRVGR